MLESGGENPKTARIVDGFLDKSWTGERQTSESISIAKDLRALDTKLRERRNNPDVKGKEFASEVYGAVHNLLQATEIVLSEPMDVGKFAGGEGREKVETPGARVAVVSHLVNALNHLDMDGEGLRDALKDSGDY